MPQANDEYTSNLSPLFLYYDSYNNVGGGIEP